MAETNSSARCALTSRVHPRLVVWLDEIGAEFIQSTPLGAYARLEVWRVRGARFFVQCTQYGWDVHTAVETLDIDDTFNDARARLGVS